MSTYWELALPVADEAAEGLTNFLWELDALGVVQEQAAGGPACLRAFFPGTADGQGLEAQIGEYLEGLRCLGFPPCGRPRLAPLADGRWAEAWREHFRPLPLGRRLLVAPPWEAPPDGTRLTVVIEPGRAFGTGHHGTTAGCLEALELIVEARAPARALDLGTGSGILAIAAARLGADSALGIDTDPDAIESANRNLTLNPDVTNVRFGVAAVGSATLGTADIVLANLTGYLLVREAKTLLAAVRPSGTLVLSGLLEHEEQQVRCAFAGADLQHRQQEGEWIGLTFNRGVS